MSFCWEYSQEIILVTLAFHSTSCCKFGICFMFQGCHVKISSHCFPPEFFLQLRPHSVDIIFFQCAVRFFNSFSSPIADETNETNWVTEWINCMYSVCLEKRRCWSGWGQIWYKDILVPILFPGSDTVF